MSVTMLASQLALADASPADKARAHTLMDAGDRFVDAKSYAEALDAYERADAIMHVPTTAIEIARTNAALGHYIAAREAALTAARAPKEVGEPAVFDEARAEAAALAGKYADKIGSLVITLTPLDSTAIVTIDGMVVDVTSLEPLPIDPGKHIVRVAAPHASPLERAVTIEDGKSARVTLGLEPASPYHTVMLAGFGAAGGGVLIGSVLGAVSLANASSAKSACNGSHCPESARGALDAANSFGLASDVFFGIAIAGAAVGGYGFFTEQNESKEHAHSSWRAHPFVGLGTIGIAGVMP